MQFFVILRLFLNPTTEIEFDGHTTEMSMQTMDQKK